MQLFSLLVQLKVHCVTILTESSVWNPLLNGHGPVRLFSSQNNKWFFNCIYIYSHISVTMGKEFTKQDQKIKRTSDNSLQKYLSHPFFLTVLVRGGIILVRSFWVQFKLEILSFIRPKENPIFKIHDINRLKLLSHIRLYFSHLN